jgi:hypothetical protein
MAYLLKNSLDGAAAELALVLELPPELRIQQPWFGAPAADQRIQCFFGLIARTRDEPTARAVHRPLERYSRRLVL